MRDDGIKTRRVRPLDTVAVPWGIALPVAVLFLFTLLAALGQGILVNLLEGLVDARLVGVLWAGLGSPLLILVLVSAILFGVYRMAGSIGMGFNLKWMKAGLAGGVIAKAATIVIGLLESPFAPEELTNNPLILVSEATESPAGWILIALGFGVVVPILEELLFRAFLYLPVRHHLGVWWAVASTSLLFGALHGHWAIALPMVAVGAIHALLFEGTGSIAVPIVSHVFFNLTSLLAAFLLLTHTG